MKRKSKRSSQPVADRSSALAEQFSTELASIELKNVFNPYRHVCPLHDEAAAADVRLANLNGYLASALTRRPATAWIGRDLGYRGGRRTGLPLTDEAHLAVLAATYDVATARKATRTTMVAERTAAEIWRVIERIDDPPFLWNAFPFHPFEDNDPLGNRCHTRREFSVCEDLFATLMRTFAFERIYAIGNDAARALERLGLAFECVRHPSYGGQSTFRRQMASAYRM